MNNEWKMVPVIATDEMIRFANVAVPKTPNAQWNAMLAAAPMPPAGDVEDYPPCDYCGTVPKYHPWHGAGMINGEESPHIHACTEYRHKLPSGSEHVAGDVEVLRYDMSGYGGGMIKADEGAFVYFDDHRAHVTRLTAERDGLLAEVERLNRRSKNAELALKYQTENYERSQSELTKARELPTFAVKVIRKLQRYEECTSDSQGADIGRDWFDLLTQLGLLNRVQRSPALWEMTQQGEDLLAHQSAPAAKGGNDE